MSGPKTSRYTVAEDRRRAIREQQRIRLELKMLEILKETKRDANSVVVQADKILEQAEPLWTEIHKDSDKIKNVKALRMETLSAINRASGMRSAAGLDSLHRASMDLREISGKLRACVQSLKKEYDSMDRSFRSEIMEHISDGFSLSFDNLGDTSALQKDFYYQKIQNELASLAAKRISDDQLARLQVIREKSNEILDLSFLKNFYAMTVLPFVKDCRAYHEAYARYGEDYERKKFIYEENAKVLGIIAEEIPFSERAITALDEKIRETEAAIQYREEQAYISRCVDEAMREMGYSTLGSRDITKRNGRKFHNALYLFEEGTAVNVTYSNDGQITMELGGIGMEDRVPTSEECASLESEMRPFCDDFFEIERRLKEKGIIANRISVLPPDAQFAQIINVSDYNLCTDVSVYEVREERRKAETVHIREIEG